MTKHCSYDGILKICEIVYNIIKGNAPLSPAKKKKLAPKKRILRHLIRSQPTHQRRKALLLNHKGGIFQLLPLFFSLLTGRVVKLKGKSPISPGFQATIGLGS